MPRCHGYLQVCTDNQDYLQFTKEMDVLCAAQFMMYAESLSYNGSKGLGGCRSNRVEGLSDIVGEAYECMQDSDAFAITTYMFILSTLGD